MLELVGFKIISLNFINNCTKVILKCKIIKNKFYDLGYDSLEETNRLLSKFASNIKELIICSESFNFHYRSSVTKRTKIFQKQYKIDSFYRRQRSYLCLLKWRWNMFASILITFKCVRNYLQTICHIGSCFYRLTAYIYFINWNWIEKSIQKYCFRKICLNYSS